MSQGNRAPLTTHHTSARRHDSPKPKSCAPLPLPCKHSRLQITSWSQPLFPVAYATVEGDADRTQDGSMHRKKADETPTDENEGTQFEHAQ
ncbi:hypothetical protein NDU88_009809 [Pleurodeles waltl]|uniref:Uncharacterized protein n=1 Tax=Pleurodeles waltl TaxID=8319 RepID=A0AAV7QW36_PLEWA|nr:hypothetical protein NDU88_009809 [Pleurodeles waltl]